MLGECAKNFRQFPVENIDSIKEYQAFSPSYDFAPPPPPLPTLPSPVSRPDRRHRGKLRKRRGEEPNHTTTRMPGPLQIIQYSLTPSHNYDHVTLTARSFSSPCLYIHSFFAAVDPLRCPLCHADGPLPLGGGSARTCARTRPRARTRTRPRSSGHSASRRNHPPRSGSQKHPHW